uniref:Glucosidase 2 subunit beta n=1 Tax=Globisporangium ultimum (strain ATCC 200006 / CBS 805.95 / DAOM BR144) TaxID=431595 RepID=K3X1Z1_GLOUD
MALRVRALLGGALCGFFAATALQSTTTALSSGAAASAPIVHGVAPEEQQQYAALECVVSGKRQALNPTRVNDDYCDCDDGADEPGTSACSHLLSSVFYCGNDGYFPKKIPTSRVNDGICDCCDGTDEFHDANLCANTCAADAVEFRTAAQAKLAAVEAGFKKRQAIIDGEIKTYFDDALEAEKETAQTLQVLEKLKERVAVHRAREEQKENRIRLELARKAQAAAEQQADHVNGGGENEETVCVVDEVSGKTCEATSSASTNSEGVDGSLDDLDEEEPVDDDDAQQQAVMPPEEVDAESHNVKAHVELADGTRISLADYLRMDRATTVKRKKPKTADQMRREDFLGPLFNGDAEGRKRIGLYALRTVGLVISPVRGVVELVLFFPRTIWDLAMIAFKVDRRRLPSLASLQASVLHAPWFRRLGDGQVYRAYRSVAWGAKVAWDAPIFAYNYLFPQLNDSVVSREAESLRKVMQEIDADIEKLTRARDEKREAAAKDYGPERAFFALNDQCIEKKIEKYTYKLCAFRDVKQDYTLLGKWEAWGSADNGDKDYARMQFIKGQKCWNGPERSVQVRLACGQENEIVSVDEPSTCVYEMLLQTPLACTQDVLAQAQHEVAFWK